MEIVERIKDNPLRYLCAALIAVLLFLGAVWAMFTGKTIPELYAEGGWAAVPIRAAIWLVIFLFLSTAIIQIPWIRRFRNSPKGTTPMILLIVIIASGAIGLLVWLLVSGERIISSDGTSKGVVVDPGKQSFLIDYRPGNCAFFTVDAPSTNRYLDNRKGLYVGDISVVNNTGGSTTLKEVVLAYDYPKEGKREVPGMVWPAGKLKSGEPALMLFWEPDALIIPDWRDIRPAIAENKEKVPGAIWRGSSTFIFEPDIKSVSDIVNPRLVARDYLGQEAERPLSPVNMTDWKMRNEPFVQGSDDSIRWGDSGAPMSLPSPKIVEREVGPKVVPPKKPDPVVEAEPKSNLALPDLFALLEAQTPLQAEKVLESYKGRWIEVEGETKGSPLPSLPRGRGCYIPIQQPGPPSQRLTRKVFCYFETKWCDELDKASAKGPYVLKVRGKINFYKGARVSSHLMLMECELISSTPP